jgi:cell division septal protein FtsQ
VAGEVAQVQAPVLQKKQTTKKYPKTNGKEKKESNYKDRNEITVSINKNTY